MGTSYVYKIFRKIKIVKYSKRWPNHIYRKVDTPEALFDICDFAIFIEFYYFNFTKYFVNIMGSIKFCVYHPGVFTKLNKIGQFQSNTPFVFISVLMY